MDYTREPLIETVVTARVGYRLALRSTRLAGVDEYFVDAVEIVSFGMAQFYRSVERPKPFLLPVSDFEVLEIREPKIVLKNVAVDRQIKIGTGKAASKKDIELEQEPVEKPEGKGKKKRSYKKRKEVEVKVEETDAKAPEQKRNNEYTGSATLLAPPSTLISETLGKYRDNEEYKSAFYSKENDEDISEPEKVIVSDLSDTPQDDNSTFQDAGNTPLDDFDESDNQLFNFDEAPEGNRKVDNSETPPDLPFEKEILEVLDVLPDVTTDEEKL